MDSGKGSLWPFVGCAVEKMLGGGLSAVLAYLWLHYQSKSQKSQTVSRIDSHEGVEQTVWVG